MSGGLGDDPIREPTVREQLGRDQFGREQLVERWQLIDRRFDELTERARLRAVRSMRSRLGRIRAKSWHIAQAALAAGVAWVVALDVLHHDQPIFAPIVAVVCLGMSYGQRLHRVAVVTLGTALGVLVADVFVSFAGYGAWQITAVVAASMVIALFVEAGGMLVTEAAIQSIFVVTLAPPPGQLFSRWLDAVVGGGVALVAAAVVPAAPLRRPRVQAAEVARMVALLLRQAGVAARDNDVARAAEVLGRARATDGLIRELEAAADEGMDVIASSPFVRRRSGQVRRVADLIDPLDRALRSTRVLVRRVVVATSDGEQLPESYLRAIDDLAAAAEVVSHVLSDNGSPEAARPSLLAVGAATASLPRTGQLSVEVVLAQIRSVVVDLLQVAGLDVDSAVASLPPVTAAWDR